MLVDLGTTSSEQLIRRLIAGDATAIVVLVERAGASDGPARARGGALVVPASQELLDRAAGPGA